MKKISMPNPIAELDGDEMTRIIWAMIKDELIKPFVELNTEYYDLSIQNRENTKDQVTVEAAEAIKRLKVGVKCATITPNLQRQQEYHLTKLWRSPNATIRAALDGTVFRAPILISKVKPVVSCWKRPITIARHAYGDIYRAVEYRVECPGKAELLFTDEIYQTVSTDAKMLYGLLLDRLSLSEKNDWKDEHGRVYQYFTIHQAQELLHFGHEKVCRLFAELDAADLIVRRRQGQGKANRIYLKEFTQKADFRNPRSPGIGRK